MTITDYLPTFQEAMCYLGFISGLLSISLGSVLLLFPSILPLALVKAGFDPLWNGIMLLLCGVGAIFVSINLWAWRYGRC